MARNDTSISDRDGSPAPDRQSGMVTPVTIKRETTGAGPYGDDVATFAVLSTVNGWLFSEPSPVITMVNGVQQALVNTYRLFLPVGTDIQSGDQVVIEGNSFTVSDTNAESTWLPLLRVSLRRLE